MSETCLLKPQNFYDQPDNDSKTDTPLAVSSSNTDFTILEVRLKTYENWPNQQLSKTNLAKAGFIYKGKDDIVVCPFCKIEGYRWVSDDNPMADHRVWSPDCPFLRSSSEHAEDNPPTVDTCGLYGIEILPNSVPEENSNGTLDLNRLGIQKSKGPQYTDKITYDSRLATFQNWPKSIKQRPANLADAGFFYTGVGDQTLCFYCGGGLKDWEESDDPWEQHALWFSKCVYVNLKKGKDFIDKIKNGEETQQPSTSAEKTKESAPTEDLNKKCHIEDTEVGEQTLCKICYKGELGVVFLPCGHIVACVDCAAALKNCAVCRKPLEATVRAFLS